MLEGEPTTSADFFWGECFVVARDTHWGELVIAATHEMYPISGHKPCRDHVGTSSYTVFSDDNFAPIFIVVWQNLIVD